MNVEFHKKHKKQALMNLAKQRKMSLEEMVAQSQRVLNSQNQAGKKKSPADLKQWESNVKALIKA